MVSKVRLTPYSPSQMMVVLEPYPHQMKDYLLHKLLLGNPQSLHYQNISDATLCNQNYPFATSVVTFTLYNIFLHKLRT